LIEGPIKGNDSKFNNAALHEKSEEIIVKLVKVKESDDEIDTALLMMDILYPGIARLQSLHTNCEMYCFSM
jgi:hypothetical protein